MTFAPSLPFMMSSTRASSSRFASIETTPFILPFESVTVLAAMTTSSPAEVVYASEKATLPFAAVAILYQERLRAS